MPSLTTQSRRALRALPCLLLLISHTEATCAEGTCADRPSKVIAYVGVRGGSKRCPRKNIKPFFGELSLIEVKLRELVKVPELSGIVVSSDDDEMLAVAAKYKAYGVRTLKREAFYASDQISHSDYWEYIAAVAVGDADEVLYAPVTAPFITAADFSELIQVYQAKKYGERKGVQAAVHMLEKVGHFWWDDEPLNFVTHDAQNTQVSPTLLEVTYTGAITDRAAMVRGKSIFGTDDAKPMIVTVSEEKALEIDTCFQFELAQLLFQRMKEKEKQNTAGGGLLAPPAEAEGV